MQTAQHGFVLRGRLTSMGPTSLGWCPLGLACDTLEVTAHAPACLGLPGAIQSYFLEKKGKHQSARPGLPTRPNLAWLVPVWEACGCSLAGVLHVKQRKHLSFHHAVRGGSLGAWDFCCTSLMCFSRSSSISL